MINECENGDANCDQGCVDTEESYFCTCDSGFSLASDGHTCIVECGGILNTASGSFQTPGWPNSYPPENTECEWIIELPNPGATIEFTIVESPFGIKGRPPCTNDHIEFFDGTGGSSPLLNRVCGNLGFYDDGLPIITTTSSSAKVVFTGSTPPSSASRIGAKVNYRSVLNRVSSSKTHQHTHAHIIMCMRAHTQSDIIKLAHHSCR